MAKIVVDSSVAIKWFIPQKHSDKSRQILSAYQEGELDLLVPDLIYAEIGNIVWKLNRFQELSEQHAKDILKTFQLITFSVTPSSLLLNDAYHFAREYQRTVYDSLYVALSLRHQCLFVTGDSKLVNAVSPAHSNIVAIENWS
ncbi:type II toxin-antitoxin system VapC family toxin [Nodosilinea sp. LEGE 06152]|uniref:type II toxin-antitoxin system VapC family toxin n=1 Tax=Nodosilinea sp. LEGE 06152 TaxID=2777966 RepID=UPI003242B438